MAAEAFHLASLLTSRGGAPPAHLCSKRQSVISHRILFLFVGAFCSCTRGVCFIFFARRSQRPNEILTNTQPTSLDGGRLYLIQSAGIRGERFLSQSLLYISLSSSWQVVTATSKLSVLDIATACVACEYGLICWKSGSLDLLNANFTYLQHWVRAGGWRMMILISKSCLLAPGSW